MPFLRQPFILRFLCRKSAVTCQTDSNKVSNSILKADLCSCVRIETMKATAPPQRSYKWGANFWDTLLDKGKHLEAAWFPCYHCSWSVTNLNVNRPFCYSREEPGSSVIFIHFYERHSIEGR